MCSPKRPGPNDAEQVPACQAPASATLTRHWTGCRSVMLTVARLPGSHYGALIKLMPLYRVISSVAVRNGERTAFWLNNWLPVDPLCSFMPTMFSHVMSVVVSMPAALLEVWSQLIPRLTAAGARHLNALLMALDRVQLSTSTDDQVLERCSLPAHGFQTAQYLCSFVNFI